MRSTQIALADTSTPYEVQGVSYQEQISTSEEEKQYYCQVYEFIANHSYPTGFSKDQKSLEKKVSRVICVRSGLLYYAGEDKKWTQVARSFEDREQIMQSCHSSAEGK